jgi:hypothetical protein
MQTSMPNDGTDQTLVPLGKIQDILSAMASQSISYCHWKSNYHI